MNHFNRIDPSCHNFALETRETQLHLFALRTNYPADSFFREPDRNRKFPRGDIWTDVSLQAKYL